MISDTGCEAEPDQVYGDVLQQSEFVILRRSGAAGNRVHADTGMASETIARFNPRAG